MKKIYNSIAVFTVLFFLIACNSNNSVATSPEDNTNAVALSKGQENVKDDESQKDIVKVALASADHSSLVAALQQADYVTVLSNAGPFTVFAPTNAAFAKLPAGTVDQLMKDDQKASLQNILEYHVSLGVFKEDMLQDGQQIDQANSEKITISKAADGKMKVNGKANILAAVPASNGLIYIVDEVLLPPAKK